jgi:hypothetical protein
MKGEQKMRQLLAATLLLGPLTGLPTVAPPPVEAACIQTIYAERAETNGSVTQVQGRNHSTRPILRVASTTDQEFARMIAVAVAQRNRLTVTGSATACPTTGTLRLQGNVTTLVLQP